MRMKFQEYGFNVEAIGKVGLDPYRGMVIKIVEVVSNENPVKSNFYWRNVDLTDDYLNGKYENIAIEKKWNRDKGYREIERSYSNDIEIINYEPKNI